MTTKQDRLAALLQEATTIAHELLIDQATAPRHAVIPNNSSPRVKCSQCESRVFKIERFAMFAEGTQVTPKLGYYHNVFDPDHLPPMVNEYYTVTCQGCGAALPTRTGPNGKTEIGPYGGAK